MAVQSGSSGFCTMIFHLHEFYVTFDFSIKHSNLYSSCDYAKKSYSSLYKSYFYFTVKDTFVHSIEERIVLLVSADSDEDKWIVFRFVTETHSCCFL